MNELVSIIVPIYNVKDYLSKCIDSIINQTYKNIEVLLVDDGSTDGCAELLEDYPLDERFKIFHKNNGGLSDARNYGLDRATGEYIFFLDSDDYIEFDAIEICLKKMIDSDSDIVECRVKHISESDEFVHVRPDVGEYDNDEAIKGILDYRFRIVAWNKLYRANLWNGIRFPKGKINEDEIIIPYIVEKCNRYTAISNPLYNYIQRTGSIMNSSFNEKKIEIIGAYEDRLKYFSKKYNKKYDDIILYRFSLLLGKLSNDAKGSVYKNEIKNKRNIILKRVLLNSGISVKRKVKAMVFCAFPNRVNNAIKQSKVK